MNKKETDADEADEQGAGAEVLRHMGETLERSPELWSFFNKQSISGNSSFGICVSGFVYFWRIGFR